MALGFGVPVRFAGSRSVAVPAIGGGRVSGPDAGAGATAEEGADAGAGAGAGGGRGASCARATPARETRTPTMTNRAVAARMDPGCRFRAIERLKKVSARSFSCAVRPWARHYLSGGGAKTSNEPASISPGLRMGRGHVGVSDRRGDPRRRPRRVDLGS